MGGNIIDLRHLFDQIFLALENEDYEKIQQLSKQLQGIDFSGLSPEEAKEIIQKINQIEKITEEKQKNIISAIEKKMNMKKYR
ncbi:hypothetical protein [Persephonella sp. KM09-Lau-8]|uniref:hypothetical protein n=1 Tax=Persephonella sp. KM09-Lau-8 TaxID=1158345 RepID=UPI000496624F|nr:hypothetical protein [Persephonella sp. KM09-Lau-8]